MTKKADRCHCHCRLMDRFAADLGATVVNDMYCGCRCHWSDLAKRTLERHLDEVARRKKLPVAAALERNETVAE